jgi:hypothetical protein
VLALNIAEDREPTKKKERQEFKERRERKKEERKLAGKESETNRERKPRGLLQQKKVDMETGRRNDGNKGKKKWAGVPAFRP